MSVKEITPEEFQKISGDTLILVDFYAEWCGPCRQMAPILEEISREEKSCEMYKIDVDKEESREFVSEQMVMSLPTLLFFKNGKRVDALIGLQDREKIESVLQKHL